MSTYVVGDVQGCFDSLMTLLEVAHVNDHDRVWLVGDLVNRGPKSLEVLRWAKAHQGQVQVVLGNHDIHLLACTTGARLGKGDTLDSVLTSQDCSELIDWLRRQPILLEDQVQGRHVAMVHAGVNPRWSWSEVRYRARAIEERLRGKEGLKMLSQAHPTRKSHTRKLSALVDRTTGSSATSATSLSMSTTWLKDLEWFTRVRAVDRDLKPHRKFKGSLADIPPDLTPWFVHYQNLRDPEESPNHLYFGHWAALGIRVDTCYTALDSGCIWGRYLSAIRIEDGVIFQTPTVERALTPKNLRK